MVHPLALGSSLPQACAVVFVSLEPKTLPLLTLVCFCYLDGWPEFFLPMWFCSLPVRLLVACGLIIFFFLAGWGCSFARFFLLAPWLGLLVGGCSFRGVFPASTPSGCWLPAQYTSWLTVLPGPPACTVASISGWALRCGVWGVVGLLESTHAGLWWKAFLPTHYLHVINSSLRRHSHVVYVRCFATSPPLDCCFHWVGVAVGASALAVGFFSCGVWPALVTFFRSSCRLGLLRSLLPGPSCSCGLPLVFPIFAAGLWFVAPSVWAGLFGQLPIVHQHPGRRAGS